ncbi:Putative ribonuclease H protein At1g65750 [Linum perenne]
MSPPVASMGEDVLSWGGENDGKFSFKSAYNLIADMADTPSSTDWKKVWNWRGPNRIRFFLWLAVHGKLLTNGERRRRHLAGTDLCPRCNAAVESVSHVLCECPLAAEVWRLLDLNQIVGLHQTSPSASWLTSLLTHEHSTLFGVTFWILWKSRNEFIFEGTRESATSLSFRIKNWVAAIEEALKRDINLTRDAGREWRNIAWEPGDEGWSIINTDGYVLSSPHKAAAGGLIRNSFGHCSLAFTVNLGACSITRAEIRGVIEGLKLAWDAGHRKVIIQTDSKAALILLSAEADAAHHPSMEVNQFREPLARDWEVILKHIYREGNHAADYLANLGHQLSIGLHLIPTSDCNLGYHLLYDSLGISEPRNIMNI